MPRSLSLGEWLGLITLMLNVLALVWGAAKLSEKLDSLVKAFDKHIERVDKIEDEVILQGKKVETLWDGHTDRRTGEDRRK
jgi:hypothetical protein